MPDYVGRKVDGGIRVHAVSPFDLRVFFRERGDADDLPCKCCAADCESQLTINVTFCGMTVEETLPIPGILNQGIDTLPDDSFLIVSASISCGPCGWYLDIGVCAYCVATNQFASDGFTGYVPFAATPEAGGGYCPEAGAVDLTCFGDQFGIPCITTATATIA